MKALFGLWMILALCAGCTSSDRPLPAASSPAMGEPQDIRDLQTLPQIPLAYLDPADANKPLMSDTQQAAAVQQLRAAFFAPWQDKPPIYSQAKVTAGFQNFAHRGFFGANRRERPTDWTAGLLQQADLSSYPNRKHNAIIVRNTDLRSLPTAEPCFESFDIAGSGYPFDVLQETALWVGTPVKVRHVANNGWAFVESPLGSGWVAMHDLAVMDDAAVRQWHQAPLAALVEDNVSIWDASGRHLCTAHIGTLLPFAPSKDDRLRVCVPVRNADGQAVIEQGLVSGSQVSMLPRSATATNVALLAEKMIGQPYGWGGMYQQRDCSSMTHDLLVPFGIWLPRNSAPQSKVGEVIPVKDLSPAQREQTLLARGRPWLTLVYHPGHVMLYIGRRDGRAVVMHNVWGLVTRDKDGKPGRRIIGRCVITTLQPGVELPDLAPEGDRRSLVQSINIVVPEARK